MKCVTNSRPINFYHIIKSYFIVPVKESKSWFSLFVIFFFILPFKSTSLNDQHSVLFYFHTNEQMHYFTLLCVVAINSFVD